jgi:hypothetical protein
MLIPEYPGRIGARERPYSSLKMTCSIRLAPRPPNSLGQPIPTHPAAYIFACQARRFSKISRLGGTQFVDGVVDAQLGRQIIRQPSPNLHPKRFLLRRV